MAKVFGNNETVNEFAELDRVDVIDGEIGEENE